MYVCWYFSICVKTTGPIFKLPNECTIRLGKSPDKFLRGNMILQFYIYIYIYNIILKSLQIMLFVNGKIVIAEDFAKM